MIFWKKSEPESQREHVSEQLLRVVREQLRDTDPDTIQIVTATAGLLACVAFADRTLTAEERAHVRDQLGLVHGLSPDGVDAICDMLQTHLAELAVVNPQAYTRTLRELGDRELRLEVLDVLLDLAAADAELAFEETQLLRRLTGALGLDQQDYNQAQARHRDRLSALKAQK